MFETMGQTQTESIASAVTASALPCHTGSSVGEGDDLAKDMEPSSDWPDKTIPGFLREGKS